jgi:N,N'-diacetylchitobiose transport system permease protein
VPSAQTWRPWLLLAPALAVLGALLLFPLGRVVVLSFQEFGLRELNLGGAAWVGFANYRDLLSDPRLWQTVLGNTVVFAIVNVVLTVVVGTLVALLLFSLGRWLRWFLTTAIMVAWAIPAVTGTYVWIFIFDSQRGPAMRLLDNLGLVDPRTTNWFDDRLTFYAIATLNVVHHGFPFVAVTVLAGLMTIPTDVIEAATIDGAGGWRRFWSITAPMLKPVFAVVTILSTIWDFKVFVQIYLMPGGNGVNRDVFNLATWSYVTAFGQGSDFGRGSAIAVMLTLVLIVITMVYLRFLFRENEL